jgi:ketosteroid isomerase-like protein
MDRATEAYFSKDYETLRTLYAPDVVATTPNAGTLNGVDALFDWNRALGEPFPDMSFELTAAHEAGDCAIDQGMSSAPTQGPSSYPTEAASSRRESRYGRALST